MKIFFAALLSGGVRCSLFFVALFFFSTHSFAEDSFLRITEIHPEQEFIELYNDSSKTLSIAGYQYSEETGSGTEKKYDFSSEHLKIDPGDFFVISLSRKINNSGDTVRIYDENGVKIAEVIIPTSVSGKSYSRIENEWIWANPTMGFENINSSEEEEDIEEENEEENQNENEEEPEEMSENSSALPLVLSEVFPNPKGADSDFEFIEIFNQDQKPISLEGWTLEDLSGKVFFLSVLGADIQAFSYRSIPYSVSKISLNNSDEKIFLKNPQGEIISLFEYSESFEGKSFARFFDTGIVDWTSSVTEGGANIFFDDTSENTSSSGEDNVSLGFSKGVLFEEKYFKISDPRTKKVKILISKVFFSSRPNKVEMICVECDEFLEGIRLGIDGEVFRIPKDIFAKNGDILEFVFEKDTENIFEPTETGWRFFVPLSGITSTDETIYLGNEKGEILDAIFYANQNRYFQKSEQQDLIELIGKGQWSAPAQEYSGVSTVAFKKDSFLKRKQYNGVLVDTNSPDDFFRAFVTDETSFVFEKEESETIPLFFHTIYFSDKSLEISLINKGAKSIDIKDYFLSNRERFLFSLAESTQWIAPGQEVRISLPRKKIQYSDVFLEIRTRENAVLDVFCFAPRGKNSKISRMLSAAYQKNILSSPLQKNCFFPLQKQRYNAKFFDIHFARKVYDIPLQKSFYTFQEEKDTQKDILLNANKTEVTSPLLQNEKEEDSRFLEENTNPIEQQEISSSTAELPRIIFSRVLPNPEGRDGGKEKIFLKNVSDQNIWLRDFLIKTEKSSKKIPTLFFAPEEEREVLLLTSFSLRNSSDTLLLVSKNEDIIDSVSWEKARDNEYFGPFATKYIPLVKEKKQTLKSLKKVQKKNDSPKAEDKSEEKKNVLNNEALIRVQERENGREITKEELLFLSDLEFQQKSSLLSKRTFLLGVGIFSFFCLCVGIFFFVILRGYKYRDFLFRRG